VADEIARHSFINHLNCYCFWDDGSPSFLFQKLINDVKVFNDQ
jgi:hypothetical protein